VPVDELSEFILERLRHQLAAEGIPADVADAVLGAGEDDAIDAAAKGEVLAELRGRPEMEPLFKGLKRVRNIVAKAGDIEIPAVDASLFQEEGERKLHFALGQARAQLEEALGRREFARALEPLIAFKDPIDQFFEEVLVMADEPDLRRNRLALCREVSELFSELADFGRIQT
jgi:glycyl-tRNA synthetase beta chain